MEDWDRADLHDTKHHQGDDFSLFPKGEFELHEDGEREDEDGDLSADIDAGVGERDGGQVQAFGLTVLERPGCRDGRALEDVEADQGERHDDECRQRPDDQEAEPFAGEESEVEAQDGDLESEDVEGPEDLRNVDCVVFLSA